jgi:dienelactone hydrolase
MKIMSTVLAASALGAASAHAALVTKSVDYEVGGTKLQGYLAYDDARTAGGKAPGVLVFQEWWGLNDYVKHRAEQLAALGYVAFAADMYGAGVVAKDPEEAGKLAGGVRKDGSMLPRAQAGLQQLLATGRVDPARVAAIGYCFGGSVAQVLAYSGAPLAGIVSFHGGLIAAKPEDIAALKAKILICHGALDPSIKRSAIDAYLQSLDDGKVDYRFVQYAGAYHAFTNPESDANVKKYPSMQGFVAYSPSADQRSWADMQAFFNEIFGPKA